MSAAVFFILPFTDLVRPVLLRPTYTLIMIMEICKAPTLQLKALNKHTHIMYIKMDFFFFISTSVQA